MQILSNESSHILVCLDPELQPMHRNSQLRQCISKTRSQSCEHRLFLKEFNMRSTNPRVIAAMFAVSVSASTLAQPVDQIPMYGGMNRQADSTLHAADMKFVADTVKRYGSREKASMAASSNAFALYGKSENAQAMRRFNQAWLLDPNNPEVYWGFAAILHDQGEHCPAMLQFEKALSFGRHLDGAGADAGRVTVLCAVSDARLSAEARMALFKRADDMYRTALVQDGDKGYVHASMASALYWRGSYAEAWAAVKQARRHGGRLPQQFLQMLTERMVEPN
jgi:tetratricopeptide (TPR) repeat protein